MRGREPARVPLRIYPAVVPDPPPPPPIRSDRTRAELVRRIRDFADQWQDPSHTGGRDPALAAERWAQAARLHEFASRLVQHRENLEALEKAEMIVLVTCCARMSPDDFTRTVIEYAREVVYVDADDLRIPGGLLRAFRR